MEEVLTTLSRDATSGKLKSVRDACNAATDGLLLSRTGTRTLEPYELRERCLLPLKIALESRSSKLASNAISGLQKLISDERFRSRGEEDVEMQLPVQFINAVVSTPSLSDEVQVEVMKMLLVITCSASCEVHSEHLIKIAEICIETYIRAHQSATKTACRATLTQMLSSVCHKLQESINRTTVSKNGNADSSNDKPTNIFATDSNKLLSLDVVLLLKHFCFRLTAGPSSPVQQTNQAVPLYLEAILVMLGSLSTSLQNDKEFITIIWQLLCPALIQLLGSPITDLSKKSKPGTGSTEDVNRGGRGSGSFPKASPVVGPIPRTIYNIANELLRLIGPLAAMRPVLESLFHRIILYPPAHQRTEALKALKEILASPQRLLDAAGPTVIDKDNPPSPDSPTEQKKTDLDLLRLLMDGIVESAHCSDSTVASCSVACVVALLGSLEDLSQGRGLSDEHIEFLSQIKETDNWEESYKIKDKYDNAASSREVPKFTVADETFGEKPGLEEERRSKGKQLRWDLVSSDHRPSPEGDIGTVTERFLKSGNVWESYGNDDNKEGRDEEGDGRSLQLLQPKSVHFAPEDEVAMFEAYEKQTVRSNNQRTGIPRRSNLPRKVGSSPPGGPRTAVRRSSSFEIKTRTKARPKTGPRVSVVSEPENFEPGSSSAQQSFSEMRSLTDLDLSSNMFSRKDLGLPLKRSNSWTALTSSKVWSNEKGPDSGDFNKTMISRLNDGVRSRPSTRPGEDALWSDNKTNENQLRTNEILSARKTYVESKANKLEARERAERANQEDRSPVKGPRPILRRTRSAPDFDRKQEFKNGKPKGILLKAYSELETEDLPKQTKKSTTPRSQVKINGVYVSRSTALKGLQGQQTHHAPHSSSKNVPVVAKKANEVKKSVEENEKEGARNFARCLLGILPSVLSLNDTTAVDESLQQFASDVCEAVTCMALRRKNVPNFGTLRGRSDLVDEKSGEGATSDPHFPILNADGVYLTVYKTLALGLNLLKSGHYQRQSMELPLTQKEFVDSILDSGVMVGLSSVWLGELYRLVTTYNILGKAGYKLNDPVTNRALVSLLSESIFNADKENDNDMFLRQQEPSDMTPAKREGTKFGRRVLLTAWDSVLEVLSLPLETTASAMGGSNGIAVMLGGESKQRDHNRERDTICLSLDGLRRAARLSCTLGIQTRCELVLALLANASCGGEGAAAKRARQIMASGPVKLHAAQVLSMDGLLAVGVELGSHAPKCWKHVFRCCSYIAELERQQTNSGTLDPSHHPTRINCENSPPLSDSSSGLTGYLNGDVSPNGDSPRTSDQSSTNAGILSSADVSRAIFALSAAVDRLFEHAANTLNIEALLSFMQALIQASQKQLFSSSLEPTLVQASSTQPANNGQQSSKFSPLHLYRLADVMLRSARNPNRPLLHLMRAWALLSPHFVEAACHRERHIAKLSITSLHDVLSEFLTNRVELPHFWFHEALFKPFESMLTLELCGEEEQEQALFTLAELIGLHTTSIKSGWRPVFRAVRSVRSYNRQALDNYELEQRPSPVFTIVSAFLGNKNPAVFGAAAVECIQSLLKFVRGSPYEEPTDDSRSDIDSIMSSESMNILNDLCLPALEHLSNMSKKLASIHIMPSSLVFHGAHSITLVDLPSAYFTNTSSPGSSPAKQTLNTPRNKNPTISATTAASITTIDDTGVLRVWYLLLEGLTSAAAYCPRRYQPQTLEVLFEIFRSITSVPGPNFSIYTITHLLLPMLREWVYRGERNRHYWESTAGNFKHACGLATELIVEELGQFLSVQGAAECVPGMIKQNLDLLIDCVSQPVEGIARLGCSCLRHLLLSGGPLFTEDLWQIVCDGLQEAVQATLFNIKDMVTCFQPGSLSVNGDEGMMVKVVARREAVHGDSFRLQQVGQQVFLLDSQVSGLPARKEPTREETSEEDEHRTFMFVLSTIENKEKPENANRVPMRSLLVGLLSHQLLLQTISSVLLSPNDDANTTNTIITTLNHEVDPASGDGPETILPGLLSYLSPANLSVLFDCLMESHTVAYEFNARPGLRSLIQKLAKLDHPANLLRQSTTAFNCYLHTLFQICKHSGEHFSSSHIKRILTGERANGNYSNGGHGHGHAHAHTHSHEKDEFVKEDALGSPNRHNDLLKGSGSVEWIVRRLHEACDQLTSVYIRLYNQYTSDTQFNIATTEFDFDRSLSWTPMSSPARDNPPRGHTNPVERPTSPGLNSSWKYGSPDHKKDKPSRENRRNHIDEDLRMIELERQMLKRKEDELLQLGIWTNLVILMLESLLGLPTLQFKAVLPAVFPAVTGLITTGTDPKVRQLVYDVVRRVGTIYGIL